MLVILQATSNGTRSRRLTLRSNQIAKVGRSEWADFSFSDDDSMAEIQFEVRSTGSGCVVRSLSAEFPTFVNGQEIQTAELHDGYQIRAGRTKIEVRIDGERVSPAATLGPIDSEPEMVAAAPAPNPSEKAAVFSLVATCTFLEFADELTIPAAEATSSDEFIEETAHKGEYLAALRLRAFLLGRRAAVWWGCLCVRDELEGALPAIQWNAVKAAAAWVGEPDEAHRRAAEDAAAAAKFSGIGATIALSAFWSGGSLAPPGIPDVPPDERLTSQGVAAALIAAAYHGVGAKAPARIDSFLAKGKQVASGEIALPDGEVAW